MSIYASFCCMGDDEDIPAPLSYRASHVMPTLGDYRSGSLDLAYIPGFVTHDGWCALGHDHDDDTDQFGVAAACEPLGKLPAVWPFLRVGLRLDDHNAVTVVLDRSQVEKLRDELTGWLGRAVAK